MAAVAAPPVARPATAIRWQALRVVTEVPENKDVAILTPVTRGTRVQCIVTRFPRSRTKFIVEQQLPNGGKEFLMAARMRSKFSDGNYFFSTNVDDINRYGQTFVGRTRARPSGAIFTILDSGGGFRHPRHLPDIVRAEAELTGIKYMRDPTRNNGPRHLTVVLPRVADGGHISHIGTTSKHDALVKAWQENPSSPQLTVLHNKPPVWDAARRSYVLDFFGRVTVASIKNFQLIDSNGDFVMQFGRCGVNEFVLDYTYPLCPLQAFGIGLSSMGFIATGV